VIIYGKSITLMDFMYLLHKILKHHTKLLLALVIILVCWNQY